MRSAATVFACPSVYEPLGIVNLEAMACELAVVATATGGIPEVVVDGQTGWLVPIDQVPGGSGAPVDPDLSPLVGPTLADPPAVDPRPVDPLNRLSPGNVIQVWPSTDRRLS